MSARTTVAQARGPLIAIALLALMALHVAPYPFSTVILDTARDLVAAQRLLELGEWPLRGPVINAMAHLGPAWFYLVAVLLALARSVAGTLLLVGVLAALKFPLAYLLGRRWRGPRYGLLFALALALPGWNLAQQVLVTHWNLVEAAVIAAALPLLALARGGGPRNWLAYGVLQSLALHAHPATVVLALALPLVLWHRRARWRSDAAFVAAGFVASLLPFVPMLVAEARDGWPALAAIAHYAQQPPSGLGWGAYLVGATHGGVELTTALASRGLVPLLLGLYALLALAVLAGLVRALRDGEARTLAWATLALVVALLALRALRPLTPFYMLLAWLPLLAAWLALALEALARGGRAARMTAGGACVALALLAIAAPAALIRRASHGSAPLPLAAFGDVAQPRVLARVALLPARQLDVLGKALCAEPGAVLHGHLAVLVDSALTLGSRLRCGDSGDPGIGGGARVDGAHRLGLVPQALRAAGVRDAGWHETRTLAPKRVLAAGGTQAVPDGSRYPFRERGAGTPSVFAIEFAIDASERVVVANAFTVYDGARIIGARAGGRRALTLHATNDVAVFACDGCEGKVEWLVEVETGFPERLDIVTFVP